MGGNPARVGICHGLDLTLYVVTENTSDEVVDMLGNIVIELAVTADFIHVVGGIVDQMGTSIIQSKVISSLPDLASDPGRILLRALTYFYYN
jgi:hypothetical protein